MVLVQGREEYGEGQGQGDISTRASGAALPSCGGGAHPNGQSSGRFTSDAEREEVALCRRSLDNGNRENARLTVRTGFLILSRDASRQVTLRSVHRERPVLSRPLPC